MIDLVYHDLRRIARGYLKGSNVSDLRPTVLVHEVYQRLSGKTELRFENRHHFFNGAAQIMRQILVKQARNRQSIKRGGQHDRITFDEEEISDRTCLEPETVLGLEMALGKLKMMDARKHQIVELRYYMGFSELEVSKIMSISVRTVRRDWRFIRIWLASELKGITTPRGES